ncbi:FAD/NAD(P)-binding domain-containing protein [Pseudovirgaria hyperparasitica]|uniref:FAD/NAD(P)-binding domain-containing protein n=1 Tax=Pseudovirgaria hyperparasitica TaxID=470096 RepID=A0A6A6W4N9_9PEZI|nr:FAD/NAD(P)-binding domain-containing protein [Pseudovirgaria hyperparasitica]KAF2756527.1 FAD/NAD(P)-binding domain-containing protein [Pseudovirgaria hyperparasitica]
MPSQPQQPPSQQPPSQQPPSQQPPSQHHPPSPPTHPSVLIIGAGLAGIYMLHALRSAGFTCAILEACAGIGGTWYQNRYPGARVDTAMPLYQFSIPEVYKTFKWRSTHPTRAEIMEYIDHLDKVLHITPYVHLRKRVVEASYDTHARLWTVQTQTTTNDDDTTTKPPTTPTQTTTFHAPYLISATGLVSHPYTPPWPGLNTFAGPIHHTKTWPHTGINVRNSRVAIIGTGASGVQLIQALGKEAKSLIVFQRTPNLCLPMRARTLDAEGPEQTDEELARVFARRRETFAGYAGEFAARSVYADGEGAREEFFGGLWARGGFAFWVENYADVLFERGANGVAYEFWARETRGRVADERKRGVLVPREAPHWFGTRRPCLETDYYEVLGRESVEVVDLRGNGIERVVREGIVTADGVVRGVDVICLATGFDALTGGLTGMGLRGRDGVGLGERWREGVRTNLGMTVSGYPNMFYLFAVHGPSASNGPSCIELQGDWIVAAMVKMREEGVESIEATAEAEAAWTKQIHDILRGTLVQETNSWYNGANVPGKTVEPLIFFGGFPEYRRQIYEVLDNDFRGFVKVMKEQVVGEESTERGAASCADRPIHV